MQPFGYGMLAVLQDASGSHTVKSAALFLGGSLFRVAFVAVALALVAVVLTRRRGG